MSVRLADVDQTEIARRLSSMSHAELEKGGEKLMSEGDELLIKILSQYDDTGYVLPEYADNPDRIQFQGHGFCRMTKEERAAYIVSEKKRMGLLS